MHPGLGRLRLFPNRRFTLDTSTGWKGLTAAQAFAHLLFATAPKSAADGFSSPVSIVAPPSRDIVKSDVVFLWLPYTSWPIPSRAGMVSMRGTKTCIGLLEEHGRRLAWMEVGAPMVQAKAGEGTNDGSGEHGIYRYCRRPSVCLEGWACG
jgi:hypothetical protein